MQEFLYFVSRDTKITKHTFLTLKRTFLTFDRKCKVKNVPQKYVYSLEMDVFDLIMYNFDLKIEVKGQKRTFLLVSCFEKNQFWRNIPYLRNRYGKKCVSSFRKLRKSEYSAFCRALIFTFHSQLLTSQTRERIEGKFFFNVKWFFNEQ